MASLHRGAIHLVDMHEYVHGLTTPKPRPVIIWEDRGLVVYVVGLTTNDRFASGVPRLPVVEWAQARLREPSYVWANRPHLVTVEAVGRRLGALTAADLNSIEQYVEERTAVR